MNRIINRFGTFNNCKDTTAEAAAVARLQSELAFELRSLIIGHSLTVEEIIAVEHHLMAEVAAVCNERILLRGIELRKNERAIEVAAQKIVDVANAKRDVRTPAQWSDFFGVEVIDPDGWRHGHQPDWHTPITRDMFKERYQMSTCRVVDQEKYAQWKHYFG